MNLRSCCLLAKFSAIMVLSHVNAQESTLTMPLPAAIASSQMPGAPKSLTSSSSWSQSTDVTPGSPWCGIDCPSPPCPPQYKQRLQNASQRLVNWMTYSPMDQGERVMIPAAKNRSLIYAPQKISYHFATQWTESVSSTRQQWQMLQQRIAPRDCSSTLVWSERRGTRRACSECSDPCAERDWKEKLRYFYGNVGRRDLANEVGLTDPVGVGRQDYQMTPASALPGFRFASPLQPPAPADLR